MSLPSWPEKPLCTNFDGMTFVQIEQYDAAMARLRLAVEALRTLHAACEVLPGTVQSDMFGTEIGEAEEALAAIGEVPQG